VALPRRRTRALLYCLAADPGAHPRDELIDRLWPNLDAAKAKRQLSDALTDLRRTLGASLISAGTEFVEWAGAQTDAVRFERSLSEANRMEGDEAVERLEEALGLYRGEFLAGVRIEDSEAFDEWLEDRRLRISLDALGGFARLARLHLDGGRPGEAIDAAERGLKLDNLREDLWRLLIEAHAARRDTESALREYARLRETLQRELGVAPEAETEALRRRLTAAPGTAATGGVEAAAAMARPALPFALRLPPGALPLVGRERELGRLLRAWSQAVAGEGGMALVVGEPGIGKSRLAAEFASRAAAARAVVLGARCPDLPDAPPYGPVEEALRTALPQLPPGALSALGKEWLPWAGRILPEVGLGAPAAEQLSPEEERSRLAEAAARLLDVIAGERPLLLVIEDVHWAHPSTVSLLHHIAQRRQRGLVLATFRDTEPETVGSMALKRISSDLSKNGLLERVELEPLARSEAEALARVALSTAGAKIRTRPAALAELSEGHPLFMLELTRSLLEAPNDPELPETLTSTIQMRVERASEYGRRVLELAVVFGEPVSPGLLARASGVEPTDEALVSAIEELTARRLLREDNAGTAHYSVSHGLVSACVYRSLSGARKRALHARAAAALESVDEPQSGGRVEALIRHYRLAGELVCAADKAEQAAVRAVALAEPDTAIARYRKAADLYARAGRLTDAANAFESAGDTATYTCAQEGAGEAYSAAMAIVETGIGDTRFRARLHRKLAEVHTRWSFGGPSRWEAASRHIEQASELTDRDETEEWSRILAARSFLHSFCIDTTHPLVDMERSERDAREAVRLAGDSTRAWLQAMDALGSHLEHAGRLEEALAVHLERVPVATKLADAHELSDAGRMAAFTCLLLGDPIAAEKYARMSEEVAVRARITRPAWHSRTVLADAFCRQGRWQDAADLAESILLDAGEDDIFYAAALRRLLAAEARAHLGDVEAAVALIEAAEADPGYDAHHFFDWTRDVHQRARAAVRATSDTAVERPATARAR